MKKITFLVCSILALITIVPNKAMARIGVGVNVGKIKIEELLKSGMSFELPPFTVINTGDEPSNYKVSLSFQSEQPELRPDKKWVRFSPQNFYLEPGKAQLVQINLKLPIITEPGDYFAYLEARPEATQKSGGTSIGVAAATKLYFTVTPGNIFVGMYYRITSTYNNLLPWSKIFLIVAAFAIAISILRKYIRLEIKAKPTKISESEIENKTYVETPKEDPISQRIEEKEPYLIPDQEQEAENYSDEESEDMFLEEPEIIEPEITPIEEVKEEVLVEAEKIKPENKVVKKAKPTVKKKTTKKTVKKTSSKKQIKKKPAKSKTPDVES